MLPSAARAASSARPAEKEEMIRFAGLTIDTLGHVLYVDGEKTELTAKEYDILLYLVNNRGIVLTRDKILNAVWGYDYFGEDRTVDWQIKHPDEHSNKYFYASIENS